MLKYLSDWRRGRDSNPRSPARGTTVFETAPFDRSGTSPISGVSRLARLYKEHQENKRGNWHPIDTKPSYAPDLPAFDLAALIYLLAVEWRDFMNAAGRPYRRDDFAVIRWPLHREKIPFTVAHDVEGDAHALREGFGLPTGFLFSHDAGYSSTGRSSC
jgi:hypothetical protein